jgi:hypothetical protein
MPTMPPPHFARHVLREIVGGQHAVPGRPLPRGDPVGVYGGSAVQHPQHPGQVAGGCGADGVGAQVIDPSLNRAPVGSVRLARRP